MKIDFNLSNPRYCNGCPCLNQDCEQGSECNLGYGYQSIWENKLTLETKNAFPFNCVSDISDKEEKALRKIWFLVDLRPQECINKHGL